MTVIRFPGTYQGDAVPVRNHLAGLRPRQRALVVEQDDDGYYSVRMVPAVTVAEKACVSRHSTAIAALAVANRRHRQFPTLYVRVIDETGSPELGGAA